MATAFIRWMLFISSFFPLTVIFGILFATQEPILAGVVVLVGLFGLITTLIYVFGFSRRVAPIQGKIVERQEKGSDVMGYIAGYIVPFATFPLSGWQQIAAFLVFVFVLGIVYVNSEMIRVNPILNLLGYRLYEVKVENGEDSVSLITRRRVKRGDLIRVVDVGPNIFGESRMSLTTTEVNTQELFDEILALDLNKCNIAICMASVAKDEAPRFARVPITDELAHAFRGLITDLIGQYRREDSRQLVMFPEFVEESLPAQYEVEHLDLSRYQNILEQLSPLKALTDLDVFDRDRRFISELRFYVIAVQTPTGEPVYFFHTYTRKMTLGRSFICSVFKDDCYDRITDPVLIFDSEIDCMCRGNTMYIFKKSGFQKIFQVFD